MRRALAEYAEDALRYMLANSDDARRIVVGRKRLVRDLQISPTSKRSGWWRASAVMQRTARSWRTGTP